MSKAKKSSSAASVKIAKDLKETRLNPVEGIYCELIDEADVFKWRIWFQGPGDTPFEGGLFAARMEFPDASSEFWHPNVYKDEGEVCISILHPPGNDPMSGEKPEERWSPAQTVSTIMLSFLSLLSDPNFSSPANVDANIDMKDNYPVYLEKVKKLVLKSKQLAPPEIWDMIPHPDTDPIQREQQRDRILQELQPKDDTLDWMHYGDTEGDEELADFDLEDDYDEISGEAEEEGEGEEEEGEDKRKEKEEKEEKDRDYGNEVNDEEEDEDSTGAEEAREGKKRKREASEEDSVPVTTKKQKGQI